MHYGGQVAHTQDYLYNTSLDYCSAMIITTAGHFVFITLLIMSLCPFSLPSQNSTQWTYSIHSKGIWNKIIIKIIALDLPRNMVLVMGSTLHWYHKIFFECITCFTNVIFIFIFDLVTSSPELLTL